MSQMSIKSESTRLPKGRKISIASNVVKILNDECITPPQLNRNSKSTMKISPPSSSIISPPKQINVTIANKIDNGSLNEKTMEHYMMQIQNIKGEKNAENGDNSDQDVIAFIYKDDDANEDENQKLNAITEEIHIDDDDEDGASDAASDFKKSRGVENGDKRETSKTRSEDIEHVCGKCYKVFRRFSGLKKHLDFCRFDSGYHLRKAQMLKNLDKIEKDAIVMENKDICFCCGESYDTFHLGHINCPDCPKSFKTQTSYERHIFITHSEDNNFPCSICNAKLRSGNLLQLHIEQHQNRGKPFACKICGKDFTRAYHLKRHQKYSSCMGSDSDSMNCKVCNKAFYRLDNLRAHLRQHLGSHNPKKPEYMCPICKNCFYSLSTLNIHTRTHTGERPFDCDLCEKKFPSLVALKKHRRYHTGEKPYTCSVCSQSFAVKEVLNRHMKRHTGERPHRCEQCGKSFIQATQLRSHAKTHIRPFKCVGCEEHFKTEKQMMRHAKIHNRRHRGWQWMCSICKSRFNNIEAYDTHMAAGVHEYTRRTTRRKERTDCAICDKNFDSPKNLHFHILKVHEADPEDVMNPNPTPKRKLNSNNFDVHKIETLSPEKSIEIITLDGSSEGSGAKKAKIIPSTRSTTTKANESNGGGGLIVQEFIIDELPSSKAEGAIVLNSSNSYTVIPIDMNNDEMESVTMNIKHTENKKGLKKSLAESLAAAIADSMESEDDATNDGLATLSEEDMKLKNNVGKLLDMLVDGATLKKFGWPKATEESVLCQVIENCGHDLSKEESACYKDCDYATRMREYVKLLFTVVIHNNSIKELLNNYPIDDVIEYVLGNEDDDNDDDDEENEEDCDDKNKITKDNTDDKDKIKISP